MKKKEIGLAVFFSVLPLLSALAMYIYWLICKQDYYTVLANNSAWRTYHALWFVIARICDRWLLIWTMLTTIYTFSALMATFIYYRRKDGFGTN